MRSALAILIRPLTALLVIVALIGTRAVSIAAAPESARATVEQMLDGIRKLRTTTDQSARASIIASINDSLALRTLAQEALGAQWSRLDAAQRSQYVALLAQLLEKIAYPRAAQFFNDVEIKLGAEASKDATRQIVPSTVKRADGSAISINYILERQSGRWRVVDIILDGQSLADTVTTQIQAVLKSSSYKGLVTQMQHQLEQNGS